MKRFSALLAIFVFLACATALPKSKPRPEQVMPQLVANARFVYVTSYDGPSWSAKVLPEDRQAVSDVQDALRKWGKYTVVYEPEQADLILAVERRGSEDVLAVYQRGSDNPLWRGMARGGLDSEEMPLFSDFRKAVEQGATRE
ncbi:MAG: hypothetical protein M3O85_03445 [Acidobacteriota bacterium]|nr:hypothetical protein [Acidobacteriota bacterium]